VEFSIDNNFEIIAGITNFECVNDDDGIGALNISLQSNSWSSSGNHAHLATSHTKHVSNQDNCSRIIPKTEDIPYEELKEEQQFDDLLEKMNEIRKINVNESVSDEKRRINAENAILMLAKFMKLDLDELEEDEDN